MTKLVLLHNSDRLFTSHKPPDDTRPFFYWYSDRFCSFQGTQKYMYIFVVDSVNDDIRLRSRSNTQDFDGLHKDFLHYKKWYDGKLPEYKYAESGIAMTFSEMVPAVTLMARSYGSSKEEWMQTDFEIIEPLVPFTKRIIKLFHGDYDDMNEAKPIRLTDIPELVALIPDMKDCLPFKEISPDADGKYHYDNWLPMVTDKQGTWL